MTTHRVNYQGLIADVRQSDLDDALRSLRKMSPEEKARFMRSVTSALDDVLKAVQRRQPLDAKTLKNTANDIGLWLANEIVEGRSGQYEVKLQ